MFIYGTWATTSIALMRYGHNYLIGNSPVLNYSLDNYYQYFSGTDDMFTVFVVRVVRNSYMTAQCWLVRVAGLPVSYSQGVWVQLCLVSPGVAAAQVRWGIC